MKSLVVVTIGFFLIFEVPAVYSMIWPHEWKGTSQPSWLTPGTGPQQWTIALEEGDLKFFSRPVGAHSFSMPTVYKRLPLDHIGIIFAAILIVLFFQWQQKKMYIAANPQRSDE